jgi:GNAT superfamily N-acetyltransferase
MEGARPAHAGDLPRVGALWEEAVAEVGHQRGGRLLVRALDGVTGADRGRAPDLAAALTDPDRMIVVGQLDGQTFGFGLAHLERAGEPLLAVVDAIYVDRPAREVGVGEAVLEALAAWAAERGAEGVDAPALPGSRAAKAFFETNGFIARLLVMHRPRGAPAAPEEPPEAP